MKVLILLLALIFIVPLWFNPNFDYIIKDGEKWLIMWYSKVPWSTDRHYIFIQKVDYD